ncbi:MAG: Two-component transcriptional response regulator, LuxR family, partial [uncultured Thermomicrobiales bacterium]
GAGTRPDRGRPHPLPPRYPGPAGLRHGHRAGRRGGDRRGGGRPGGGAAAGRRPDGHQDAEDERDRGDATGPGGDGSGRRRRADDAGGRRLGVCGDARWGTGLRGEGRGRGRDAEGGAGGGGRRGAVRPGDRRAADGILRRDRAGGEGAGVPRPHRARARRAGSGRAGPQQRRDRRPPVPEPEDGAQPHLKHLRQAAGDQPRPGDRAGPRGGDGAL